MEMSLSTQNQISEEHMRQVLRYLGELQYGSITLVVHDGKVVMVEKVEKIKLV